MFHEDEPRLPGPNFYYSQEDILLAAVAASSGRLTWNVHRSATIIGVSPIALVNVAFFLASYALMCKEEGVPFRFPGDRISWESHTEFTDTYLIAGQQIWAATHHVAHNQAFNVSNGDVAPWTSLWPAIASFFDLEVPAYTGEPVRLADAMQGKAHVWETIVSRYKLHPTPWESICVGWSGLDLSLLSLPPYRISMEKSSKLGFRGYRDSTTCLLNAFRELRKMGIIP
ncbi:hypothetical protein L7F22_052565 [Adiantum nelumboides]|nr:hypothetical protein [Adiantum nelumboides]